MIAELALPRLGETMETGRVVAWLKQPGERFSRGETLVEIESDKTVVEMPALASGVLTEILAPVGQDVEVGAALCRYESGEAAPAKPAPSAPAPAIESRPVPAAARGPTADAGDRARATPLARNIARNHGVDLSGIVGTGPRGRIEAEDVRRALGPPAADPAGPRHFAWRDGRLAYRQWGADGAARTLALLHGFAGDSQTWAGLAALAARGDARVLALDLPGHGATTLAAAGIADLVEPVAAFLDAATSGPVELAGHSLGGAVAASVAAARPNAVSRLTLIAPAGLDRAIDTDFVRSIARVRSAGALAHLLRRLAARPPSLSAAQLDAMAGELARGRLIALADMLVDDRGQQIDIAATLRSLPMPVRVIWGLADQIIPWTQASQAGFRAAIHLLEDAGHMPHWDRPAEVAALLA